MKQQFKKLFNSPFSTIADFLNQVLYPIFGEQNFTPGYNILTNDPEIKERATCAHIEQIIHTGTFSTDLAADIKLFEVIVSDHCNIERSRINIQQLIRSYVDTFEGAFMVFHYQQPENRSWRFSYVKKRTSKADSTSAKRYTYLLGPNQACRTVTDRFYELYKLQQSVSLQNITDAFSVEALSDEFFDKYRELYANFVQYISGKRYEKISGKWTEVVKHQPNPQFQSAFNSNDKAVRDYAKKMMGRLVFLQFLQRKGWLGVPAHMPWGQGNSNYMQQLFYNSPHQDNFLEKVLEPLFFDTLNKSNRPNQIADSALGTDIKIPFLNGGLFEKDNIDERVVVFPKLHFQQLFDFFGEYNFTIDENDPNDATIGIDPEMLGRIFENLLEDNKDKGAFYTPKVIVQYMCQQSLIEYLSTHHCEATTQIKQLVLHHRADTLSDDLKQALAQQLHDIKVCDPAIGSGAFPMGILNELFKCRTALESNTQTAVELKKHIIQNNIYGVDIEQGAIDIARLRFWLSIVVDETEPSPLPNLDYKIMQGNSLLESYAGYDLSQLTTQKKDTVANATLTIFDDQLDILRRKLSDKIAQYFSCNGHTLKQQLKTDITNNILQQIKADNISIDLTDIDLAANDRFFLWHTFFADVFQRGGFDIVIGNPPYLRIQGIRESNPAMADELSKKYDAATGSFDLYALFVERGLNIMGADGVVNYIMPVKWTNAAFGKGLRSIIIKNNSAHKIIDFGAYQVFNASTYTGLQWFKHNSENLQYCELDRNLDEKEELRNYLTLLNKDSFANIPAAKLSDKAWVLTVGETTEILNKLEQQPRRISDIFEKIFQGLATSKDDVYFLYESVENETTISGYSKHLAQTVEIEKGLVKPLLKGDGVHRYDNISTKNFVIFPYKLENGKANLYSETEIAELFPLGYNYLKQCEDVLRGREKGRFDIDGEWFQFGRKQGILSAENEKLVAPEISFGGNFAYDAKGEFYSTTKIYGYIKKEGISECYKFWLGLFNSNLFWFFMQNTGYILRGGYYTFKTNYINPFPVPASEVITEKEPQIITLVNQILALKAQDPQADTSTLEVEIDQLVYALYDLTEEEIAIIEHR